MNKSELVHLVAQRTGLLKKEATMAIDAALDIMAEKMADGEKVMLVPFGTFEVKSRKPRMGRNPRTGEPVHIGPRKAATFRPGKGLKNLLNP
ncbi:MAG: HU family DNA-binding protein [Candidatus Eremiobacteraeota bacterium]|nr:HU family DNA-binding protein [Candidatus Eremiobacteraeota bacterium]